MVTINEGLVGVSVGKSVLFLFALVALAAEIWVIAVSDDSYSDEFLALSVAAYTLSIVVVVAVAAWYLWRSTATSSRSEKLSVRSGVIGGVFLVGTLGTAEAGILGFEPVALVTSAIIGVFGFAAGAAGGALAAFMFRLK